MSGSAFVPPFCASIGARREAEAEADAYRRWHEGAYGASPQPKVRAMSEGTRRFVKIATVSCTTIIGIIMLGSVFVSRFVYQNPILQDPYEMVALIVIALGVMGTGFIPTLVVGQEVFELH